MAKVAPVVAQEELAPKKTAEVGVFRALARDYYNPFTKQTFKKGCDTDAVLDGWLTAQIDAGLILKVD